MDFKVWSDEEDNLLIYFVKKLGTDWKSIAQHFTNHFLKEIILIHLYLCNIEMYIKIINIIFPANQYNQYTHL